MEKHKILALIPARAGSKGVPNKNIYPLDGKPLIAWTITEALKSKYLDKVVVSTDSEKIAEISKKYGADVPFLRPSEIAGDTSPVFEAIFHALDWFKERGETFDILLLLQPTSPLRTVEDIDKSIETFLSNPEAQSLISVKENDQPPFWSLLIENGFLKPAFGKESFSKRRQDLPETYFPNGAIYLSYVDLIRDKKTFYTDKVLPFVMPNDRSIDIDTKFDILLSEFLLKQREKRHEQ